MVENKPVPQSSWNCNIKWKLKQKFWFLAGGTDEAHQKSSRSTTVKLELVLEPQEGLKALYNVNTADLGKPLL